MATVYVDLDGVLADFATPAEEFFGISLKTFVRIDGGDWARLQEEWPTFWMDLDYAPHALDLWRAIQPWKPSLLSAIPDGWPSAGTGKQVWAKRMLPKFGYHPEQKLHAVKRSQKQTFAMTSGRPNVLIDDLDRNIHEWDAAGGIGIHYQPSQASIAHIVKTLRAIV